MAALAMAAALALPVQGRALLHDGPAAGPGEWVAFEGGRARLLAARKPEETAAVMEVELEPGWKTYWTAPGASGIPPVFDLRNSENVALDGVDYPVPVRFQDAYGESVGYRDDVAFPLRLSVPDPDATARLAVDATIGVCAEICVPISVRFAVPLVGTDPEAVERVRAARLALPVRGDALEAELGDGMLTIPAGVPTETEAFIAPPEGTVLDGQSRDGEAVTATLARGDGEGDWRVVVRSGSGPLARSTVHDLRIAR